MEKEHNSVIEYFEPIITEKQMLNSKNVLLAFVIGFIFIVFSMLMIILLQLTFENSLALLLFIIIIYSILLFFLLEPRIIREIHRRELEHRTIEKPVIKEIIKEVEKPVVKEIIREIEVPVEKPVFQKVYLKALSKNSTRIKYDYVGSSETKVYHKNSCRLGKSIKRKYKISNNDKLNFKKKGFRGCKLCKP